MFPTKCFVGSNFPSGFFVLLSMNFDDSFYFLNLSLFTRTLSFINQDWCATLSLNRNKDLMFLVDHKTITHYFTSSKSFNSVIKLFIIMLIARPIRKFKKNFTKFSKQYCLVQKKYWLVLLYFSSKSLIIYLTKLTVYPASKYFYIMVGTSALKSEAILKSVCKSPFILCFLHLLGI